MPTQHTLKISIEVYANDEELSEQDLTLLQAARKACDKAYAPYSNFWVGAAVQLASGEVVTGSNQENAAYPSGMCAERSAIYWVGANYPNELIETIAVSAKHANASEFIAITPCGACRQALSEYENKQEKKIRVMLEGPNGQIWIVPSVESLLPLKFSDDSLINSK